MAFNSAKLAKLISSAINDVDEDELEDVIQATIEKYMKSVKAPKGKKAAKDPNAPKTRN